MTSLLMRLAAATCLIITILILSSLAIENKSQDNPIFIDDSYNATSDKMLHSHAQLIGKNFSKMDLSESRLNHSALKDAAFPGTAWVQLGGRSVPPRAASKRGPASLLDLILTSCLQSEFDLALALLHRIV